MPFIMMSSARAMPLAGSMSMIARLGPMDVSPNELLATFLAVLVAVLVAVCFTGPGSVYASRSVTVLSSCLLQVVLRP